MAFDRSRMDPKLLAIFDAMGLDDSMVTSGYRDEDHNRAVGGAKHSQHLRGGAVDYNVANMPDAARTELARRYREKGGGGLGFYNNTMHFDTGPERAWGADYTSGSIPEQFSNVANTPSGRYVEAQGSAVADIQNDILNQRGEAEHAEQSLMQMFATPMEQEKLAKLEPYQSTVANTTQGLPTDIHGGGGTPDTLRGGAGSSAVWGDSDIDNLQDELVSGASTRNGADGEGVLPTPSPVGTSPANADPSAPLGDQSPSGGNKRKFDFFRGMEGFGLGLSQMSTGQTVDLSPVFSRRDTQTNAITNQGMDQQRIDASGVQEARLQRAQNIAFAKLAQGEQGAAAIARMYAEENPNDVNGIKAMQTSQAARTQYLQQKYSAAGTTDTPMSEEAIENAAAYAEKEYGKEAAAMVLSDPTGEYAKEMSEEVFKRTGTERQTSEVSEDYRESTFDDMERRTAALEAEGSPAAKAARAAANQYRSALARGADGSKLGSIVDKFDEAVTGLAVDEGKSDITSAADTALAKVKQGYAALNIDTKHTNDLEKIVKNDEAAIARAEELFKSNAALELQNQRGREDLVDMNVVAERTNAMMKQELETADDARKKAATVEGTTAFVNAVDPEGTIPGLRELAATGASEAEVAKLYKDATTMQQARADDALQSAEDQAVSDRFTELSEQNSAAGKDFAADVYKSAAVLAANGNVAEAAAAIKQLEDRPSDIVIAEWMGDVSNDDVINLLDARAALTGNARRTRVDKIHTNIMDAEAKLLPKQREIRKTFDTVSDVLRNPEFQSGIVTNLLMPVSNVLENIGMANNAFSGGTEAQLVGGLLSGLVQKHHIPGSGPLTELDAVEIRRDIGSMSDGPGKLRASVQYHRRRLRIQEANVSAKRTYFLANNDLDDTDKLDAYLTGNAKELGLETEVFVPITSKATDDMTAVESIASQVDSMVAAGRVQVGDVLNVDGKLITYWGAPK